MYRVDERAVETRGFVACHMLMLGLAMMSVLSSVSAVVAGERVIPEGWSFRAGIESPSEFGGHAFGTRHWPHHEVVRYMRYLAEHSERVSWEPYATSHGGRELGYLLITSPENRKRLKGLAAGHRRLADPARSESVDVTTMPLVIEMGYGVHGDESSATHASLPVAYLLAAGEGAEIESWLNEMVILLDPSLNPDGFDRFSRWANTYRGRNPSSDPLAREHRQAWPGGRVNYYWFDLNRDWLPAVHPESQGRLGVYHHWKPDVVLDFHEMGTNSSYFFQPGEPQRTNPLSPMRTRELTREFAEYHARALDAIDSIYFTEERYDDFYPGKGSTYPDLHGAVGILFEQGSARGNVQESVNGDVLFWKTIRNQVTTSLSSLRASSSLRVELLENKRESYRAALQLAAEQPTRCYAFTAPGDLPRLLRFARLLERHDLRVQWQPAASTARGLNGESIELPEWTLLVPTDQAEYRMLRTMFDRATTFEESIFYDVSAWSLPLAFDLNEYQLTEYSASDLRTAQIRIERGPLVHDDGVEAYVMKWSSSDAARELSWVLREGWRVKVATESFVAVTDQGEEHFEAGAIVIPLGIQDVSGREIARRLRREGRASWSAMRSGLTPEGVDLGSGGLLGLPEPQVLLAIGDGISRYDSGALWHWFDTELEMPVSLVDSGDLGQVDWDRYTVAIFAGGGPAGLEGAGLEKLKRWLGEGGTLLVVGEANSWASRVGLVRTMDQGTTSAGGEPSLQKPYARAADDRALELLSGVILESSLDLTHPLCWGFSDDRVATFRNHEVFLSPTGSGYSNPAIYTQDTLLAGYASEQNQMRLSYSGAVVVYGQGRGRVIGMADMPVFRGFFHGSARLLNNAVFFGPIIESR